MRTRTRGFLAGLVLTATLVGGVAWATIPDANGLYTACKLNATGTIRLIDPSGPNSSLLSRCTSHETKITWNQKGPAGAVGAAGPAGPAGVKGDAGPAGTDGPQGPKGDQGSAGPEGPNGEQGAQGPAGEPGSDGAEGATGAAGSTGPIGPSGPEGPNGEQGAQGPAGEKGEPGSDGAEGATGAAGPTGPIGPSGAPGPAGPTGPGGAKGDPGPRGPSNGYSAKQSGSVTLSVGSFLTIVSVNVPAGTYIVIGKATVGNTSNARAGALCDIYAAGNQRDATDSELDPTQPSGPTRRALPVQAAFTLTTSGVIELRCALGGPSTVTGYAQFGVIQAIRLESLN